jgi:hypothetical protein
MDDKDKPLTYYDLLSYLRSLSLQNCSVSICALSP